MATFSRLMGQKIDKELLEAVFQYKLSYLWIFRLKLSFGSGSPECYKTKCSVGDGFLVIN